MIVISRQISKQEEVRAILKDERLMRGMTQEEFASYIGVSTKCIAAWESGERNPGQMDVINKALRKLGRSVTLGKE